METEKYLKDLSEIKELMDKSSKFFSLSGISGIMAGIYALLGSGYVYWLVQKSPHKKVMLNSHLFYTIITVLAIVLLASVATSILLTSKKAKKNGENPLAFNSKRMIVNFITPLLVGGIYILSIYDKQAYAYTGALMLLFYGLALVNASKHHIFDWKNLGYTEIFLGLLSAYFTDYAFWFWVLGFGVLHIVYGAMMYFNHEREL